MNRRMLFSVLIVGVLFIVGALLFGINMGKTKFVFSQQFNSEQYLCDGGFEIPVTIKNPLATKETVTLQLRDSNNIQNGSLSTGQISLNGNQETVVEVFGKLTDVCRDGKINILASGTRISGLFEVEAQAFGVDGAGPGGRTPDNTGFFDYNNPNPSPITFTCCGVGSAGRYVVDFLPSENVNLINLAATPAQFNCVGEEDHVVNITGKLADLSRPAMVRARVKTPLGSSCRVKTDIEAAR
ncbi:MAG: hypothetical protein V7721_06520 [Porticoccaceae bacterium]